VPAKRAFASSAGLGITDLPYQGFVEAVRTANLAVPESWLPSARPAKTP
jgi:hypothetical protein